MSNSPIASKLFTNFGADDTDNVKNRNLYIVSSEAVKNYRCVAPVSQRPKAKELLDDPFLAIKKENSKRDLNRPPSQKKVGESVAELPGGTALVLQDADISHRSSLSSDGDVSNGATVVKVCFPSF